MESKSDIDIQDKLDSHYKQILEEVNEKLEQKEQENYSFADWFSKSIKAYYEDNLEKSLEYIDNALETKASDIEILSALYNKGVVLGSLENGSEEAIKVYDEVVERFGDSKDNKILEKVASALVNKIELAIFNNLIVNKEIELYKQIFVNIDKHLKIELLEILNNAKTKNQDDEIKKWLEKYRDIKFKSWSFEELKEWANLIKDKIAAKRIEKYIKIFEDKFRRDQN